MEFEPMLTPREKSPLPKKSPEEDRTRDAVESEPKHYQLSYSGPGLYFKKSTHPHKMTKVFKLYIIEKFDIYSYKFLTCSLA